MDASHRHALLVAGLFGVVLVLISAVMIWNWSRAARGVLPRNANLGVRTPSTLRSDQSWVAGNRAALRLAPLYLLYDAVACASLFLVARSGGRPAVIFAGSGALVGFVALSVFAAVIGGRAARSADKNDGTHSGAGQSLEMANLAESLPGRAPAIIGWTVAVAASAGAVALFLSTMYGYNLASHHQLPPNGTFGFRDEATRRCLPAWYNAQAAGFSWLLFGYGPVLVLSVVCGAGVSVKRRSPWLFSAVVMATLFLLILAVMVAGVHADSVARSTSC